MKNKTLIYMNTIVKIRAKNVLELLKLLGKSDEIICTLNLDLEMSKVVVKLLDNYSEDWDFIEEIEEPQEEPKSNESQHEPEELEPEPNSKYYTSVLGVVDYNSMATLVESIYRLYKTSPNIKFESNLFYSSLKSEYSNTANTAISVEHALLSLIIETYYKDTNIQEAIDDTVGKLKELWISKKLSDHPGTTSLTKVLYGRS